MGSFGHYMNANVLKKLQKSSFLVPAEVSAYDKLRAITKVC